MAIKKCKGTLLKVEIASVFTTVAQVIELDVGQDAIETFEADYLENSEAYIPHEQTGRSSAADVSGTLFYDPALANHQFITDTIAAPAKVNGKIVLVGSTELVFVIVSFAMGLAVRMNDGLKSSFTLKRNAVAASAWPS